MDLQNKETLFSNFFIQKNAFVHHESAWKGYIALSQWLVWKLRPQVFVELGVQHGTSYFSFCQRIVAEHLGTRCYAVDTWKGDENTGEYTEHIFTDVSEYNKAYSDFSTLIRSKFAEALPRFEDRSIDILHIDGAHSYEAIKEDFSLYLPKISDKGIVLLHDSAERGEGFGVWRFVDELSSEYPCFSFKHSHGLTIIAIGSQVPGLLGDLLALDISDEEKAGICSAFEQLNHLCLFPAPPDQRVYPRLGLDFGGGFTRGGEFKYCSSSNNIRIQQHFSEILHLKQFYVQPLWGSCILQFASCCVTLLNGKQVFLSPERSTGYSIGSYYFFETNTPQFYFAVNEAIKEITVSFVLVGDTEMLMAVKGNALQNTFHAYKSNTETRLEALEKTLTAVREENTVLVQSDRERDTAQAELAQTQNDLAAAYTEVQTLRGERDAAHAELAQTQNDLAAAYTEAHALRGERDAAQAELAQTQNDLAAAYTEAHALRGERDAAHAELAQTQNDLAAAYTEAHALRNERDAAQAELGQTQNDLAAAYTEAHALRGERDAAHAELAQTQNDLAAAYTEAHALRGERDAAEKHVTALQNSLSWAVTAPLRLTYDILAWPYRAAASFNMRRTLFSLRYSRVGGALYDTCLSQAMKNRINQAWSGETFAPSYPAAIPQPVTTPNSHPIVSESPKEPREPVFIPDPAWYEQKRPFPIPADCPVKIIAFYLPQFHPIPENDAWWGEGFTEWTNVTKARPLFDGHYQPKLPGAMGFYDLRLPEVLRKQAALAKEFGIYGFCFHHYYFAGKRLLETPVNNLLANPDIDLPFCLCWANENWTRRWDGLDQEILIAQKHTPEDDIRFLEDIQKYFDDPRYIRVDGKPFLIIYKASQFPDMKSTIKRWREYAATRKQELYLVMAQTFGDNDPKKYGFDAAIEFPPHKVMRGDYIFNKKFYAHKDFKGKIYDASLIGIDELKNSILYRTIFPNWDNTARRNFTADIFISSPDIFEKKLSYIIKRTYEENEKENLFIFINAWNEWAEGAYLEPDRVYGYSFLNKVSKCLYESNNINVTTSAKFDDITIVNKKKQNICDCSNKVTVIVPVFNAVNHIKKLILSFDKDIDKKYKIIFIDDCSTDKNVIRIIQQFCLHRSNSQYYRNKTNSGFSYSINYGASLCSSHFIILNSDVEVPSNWVSRLMLPIFEHPNKISSTTPFSNAATIFSLPYVNSNNKIFRDIFNVHIVDTSASKISYNIDNTISPTAVGFCMGINRIAWDECGGFDAKTFGKGYGEEVDWCFRCKAKGFVNVLVPNLYVAHFHGGSFSKNDKKILLEQHQNIIEKKWPTFISEVNCHLNDNRWEIFRAAILFRLIANNIPLILFIDHGLGGGTNTYSFLKIANLISEGKNVIYISYHPIIGFKIIAKCKNLELTLKLDSFENLLSSKWLKFDQIIINSLVHWTTFSSNTSPIGVDHKFLSILFTKILNYIAENNILLSYMLHDYYCICPSYTLLDTNLNYCFQNKLITCDNCMKTNRNAVVHRVPSIEVWRDTWSKLLSHCDEIFVFSETSANIFKQVYGTLEKKLILKPHSSTNHFPKILFKIKSKTINIAFVGNINYAKGAKQIIILNKYLQDNKLDYKIHIIGEFHYETKPDNIVIHGEYNIKNLPSILIKNNINVAFISSVWPETFNYVASELIEIGIPLVSFNIGAHAERIKKYTYGAITDINDPASMIKSIKKVVNIYYNKTNY